MMRIHGFIVLKTVAVCLALANGMILCPCRWMQSKVDTGNPWWDQGSTVAESSVSRLKAAPAQVERSEKAVPSRKIGVTGSSVQGMHNGLHMIASRPKIFTRALLSSGWGIAKLHVGGKSERRAKNRRTSFNNSELNAWSGPV